MKAQVGHRKQRPESFIRANVERNADHNEPESFSTAPITAFRYYFPLSQKTKCVMLYPALFPAIP